MLLSILQSCLFLQWSVSLKVSTDAMWNTVLIEKMPSSPKSNEAFREEQGKLPKQVQNCLERAGKGACHAFIAVDGWGWVRAPTSELLPGSDWGGTAPSYQLSKMRNKGKRIAVRLQTFCRETLKMESGYYISKLHSFAGKKNLMNKIFSILFLCDNF